MEQTKVINKEVTPKFSFSKLETYGKCPFQYKLKYVDGHYVEEDTLATEFGTLCHHIFERIGAILVAGGKPDYEQLRKEFKEINIPKKNRWDSEGGIYGINVLQERYPKEFFDNDNKDGLSYGDKAFIFLGDEGRGTGMFSLERYLKDHPTYQIKAVEQYFELSYHGAVFSGYIDRVLFDKATNEYIIEDIKTKGHQFDPKDLPDATQQFIVYMMAIKNMYNLPEYPTRFAYDLPFVGTAGVRQIAGDTRGWATNGIKKLDKRLDDIWAQIYDPHPTPLCHWCAYCGTNKAQPKDGKFLCPYYSLWTQHGDDATPRNVLNAWQGWEKHDEVMDHYLYGQCNLPRSNIRIDFEY